MKKIILLVALLCLTGCAKATYVDPPRDSLQVDGQTGSNKTDGLNNDLMAWGFKREKNKAPDMPQNYIDLLKKYDGYYLGKTDEKVLYLTFDEGYENGYTARILDVLKKTKTPAAFFVTGPYLNKEHDLIQRMVNEGHIVGNHTINHPSMPSVTDDEALKAEIQGLADAFSIKFNKEMTYFRPPRGEFSERTLSICKEMGYKTIFWSSAYVDWNVDAQKGTENAVKQVTEQFHNGSVIILHAVSKDNANALEEIINTAKNEGYRFASLDEL